MPVSLSEWRVRIGTFAHWIREYEVNERRERLLKERIRRLKVLCERLEANLGDSGEKSEDDKSRQDGPDPKGCPHTTANIRSSGNSSDIKDLLTSCDQCIQELLTASDSHIREILTPSDTCIKRLLTPRRERLQRIRRLKVLCERLEANMGDSGEESEDDKSRQEDPDPKRCPHKTLNIRSSGNSSDIKDLPTSCDHCIQELLTASDSHIKDILTSPGGSINELITPNDCSIKSPNTLNDSTIKDVITPNDSGIKDLVTTNDSRIQNLVKANNDSRIQGLFKANDDSRIQDLLTTNYSSIRDPITPNYCNKKDVIVSKNSGTKTIDTQSDSSTKEFNSLNASSIKDLITPNDSSIIDLITSEYSNVKDLITANDSKINNLLSPNENNIKQLIKPDDDYIQEQLAHAYDYIKTVRTRHSMSDASLRELLTSSYPSTKCVQTSNDDLNADLILKTSYIIDHETQSDGSVKELSSPGSGTTVCRPFAPCDDFLVELLKPFVSTSKDLPSIDLHVCCYEPDRRNEPFSEENGKLPHFMCKEQHPQPDTITKEATDDELLKEHQTSSGSFKKSQTEPSIHAAVRRSPVVPIVLRKYYISERHGEKQMGESVSSCHGPSFKSKTDLISGQIPPLSELLLLKSGDVELNPGPREAAEWSLDLEKELLSLVKDVSPVHYYELCNALDVSYAQSQGILKKNFLDVFRSLFEVICNWGVKQRDGTNYKTLLAEKLRSIHLDALGTKLVEGGYSTQDTPTQFTDEVHHVNKLTQEEVIRCGEEFKTFYRTEMCKIKTDPLDFDSLKEFENIYTNLVLLRNEMGTNIKTTLKYDDLLTNKKNGEFPTRLLVEGEGGAGKTTFCSKIAWDWAKGEAYGHFDWVIVIPMREIQDGKTVGDIAKTYLSDGNMVQPRQIDDYILSEPSKVLIIFDGLDEYSRDIFSDESDFGKIIRSEKFKKCIILITSRPWRANQIKSHQRLCKIYTFIGVEGFSSENVSFYINRYFVDDNMAGADLIKFMGDNDVIKENMAPFPIYVAMLCILWRESTKERREVIRRLKTFSQLFHQMIAFLKEHYISKSCNTLTECHSMETESINKFLIEIGKIAFSGLLDKRLTFNEKDFSSCKEAMDVCSKIGVLSREKRFARRAERAGTKIQHVTFDVSFPHKLFQEYVAALYLAALYGSNYVEYTTSINKILKADVHEFKYLLYFTSSQGKGVGLDIINRLDCEDEFLVDVAYEAYDADSGRVVGQRIFREQNSLKIDDDMSAHTLSGYLFIMEQHAMKTLILSGRECGPTVSRDLADALSSPTSLTSLTLSGTTFHDDFYRILLDHVSISKKGESINAVQELHIDDCFFDGIHKFDTTIKVLFPRLKQLTFTTLETVSPGVVERLAHSSLEVLSIEHPYPEEGEGVERRQLVPLIGEPTSLGQLFSSLFQQLTCLTFRGLVMGNIRSEAILHNLKNHLHLKSISIISCFTDEELDPLAEQITTKNRMKITLQHDTAQRTLYFDSSIGPLTIDMIDALCHRTCVHHLEMHEEGVEIAGEECFPDLHGREVDSKLQKFIIRYLRLHDDQSTSYCLGKFLSLLPHLTYLEIESCSFHDDFYKEIADQASLSQIQKFIISYLYLHDDQSASYCLGKFLSLLFHLTHLTIQSCSFHDDLYKEIADQACSSQIQTVHLDFILVLQGCSASKQLANFLCSLPCLANLEISGDKYLCDDFFTELESLAASSQNPYFREKQHISVIQEWSVRKQQQRQQQQQQWLEQRQQQQRWLEQQRQQQGWLKQQQQWWSVRKQQQQQQINQCEGPMPSTHKQPSLSHHVPLLESAPPSGQLQSYHHRGIQSEPEQTDQSTTYQQLSPIMPLQSTFAPDQLTNQHLEEFEQYLQSYLSAQHNASHGLATQYSANSSSQETLQHSPHHGLGEATQNTPVSQRQQDATPIETDDTSLPSSSEYINARTSVHHGGISIGKKPIYENDDNLAMPSTSGLSSAQSRTDADDSSATGIFGAIGGELSTRSHGFTLRIPPGALEEDKQIRLQVLTEIPNSLTLEDNEILVSHGFQCYPSGLSFKKPAKLTIPHCALVIDPNKVQTILYSWNQSGTPKRLQHSSDITCSVRERWLEISISHFSGGIFSVYWDWLFLKGILLSCMSFLPSVLPSNRRPLLEVRFVKKHHGQKWVNGDLTP